MHLFRYALYCVLAILLPLMPVAMAAPVEAELSPDEIIQRVAKKHAGQVIKMTREHVNGQWVYRVRLLANGHITELHVDAQTGDAVNQHERAE